MRAVVFLLATVLFAGYCEAGIGAWRTRTKTMDNPYVTLYANEYHRGEQHVEFLKGGCKNLPESRDNWASSVDTHKRCIDVCDLKDCEGRCIRIYPSASSNVDLGLRLSLAEFNDQATSLKSCYTLLKG